MRYLIQILVMFSDIVIFSAVLIIFYTLPWYFSIPICYTTYKCWKNQGGLIAWTHYKQFLKNSKEIGL